MCSVPSTILRPCASNGAGAWCSASLTAEGANGLPAMRFDGNDSLSFTTRLTDVRTVFWVLKEDEGVTGNRPLLGDTGGGTNWRGGSGDPGTLFDGYATETLQNAQIWVNGVPANGTQAKRPRTWSVVSLVTSATVAANNFGAEDGGMYWWGDLAELIIYNQPLSDEAREQVETYLKARYGIQ